IFVMDLYAAAIAAATARKTIPQSDWDGVRVYLPASQRRSVIKTGAFARTDAVRAKRIFPEELAVSNSRLVMPFRMSMAKELETAECLAGAQAVWSMWPGYLRGPSGEKLRAWLDQHHIPLVVHHASGHASIADLGRLVEAMDARRIVPIHSEAGDRFRE